MVAVVGKDSEPERKRPHPSLEQPIHGNQNNREDGKKEQDKEQDKEERKKQRTGQGTQKTRTKQAYGV